MEAAGRFRRMATKELVVYSSVTQNHQTGPLQTIRTMQRGSSAAVGFQKLLVISINVSNAIMIRISLFRIFKRNVSEFSLAVFRF